MKYETLKGILAHVVLNEISVLQTLGITQTAFEVLSGPIPWVGGQLHSNRQTLDTLIYGSLEIGGIDRFPLPAEFIAANIAHYISPCNIMQACKMVEGPRSMVDLATENIEAERMSASQLFAIVMQIKTIDMSNFKVNFERKTKISQIKQKSATR